MSYILGDLKTKLQTQIGDPNLDDTVMADALNYTQSNIFDTFDLTLNSAQQTNAVAAGANVLTSALPTDYQRMSSMYITSPTSYVKDLTPYFIPVKDFRANYPASGIYSGPLREWTYWTSIEFYNLSPIAVVVKLDYIKYIPVMTNASDVPTIPVAFEELIMLGAKMRIYEQKEDFDYANQFANRYADLLEAFVTRYSTRQVDNQMVIQGSRSRVQNS